MAAGVGLEPGTSDEPPGDSPAMGKDHTLRTSALSPLRGGEGAAKE